MYVMVARYTSSPSTTTYGILKINLSTFVITSYTLLPNRIAGIDYDGTYLYAIYMTGSKNICDQINPTTMGVVSTWTGQVNDITDDVLCNIGYVFIHSLTSSGPEDRVTKVDPATMTTVAVWTNSVSSPYPNVVSILVAAGNLIFKLEVDGRLSIIRINGIYMETVDFIPLLVTDGVWTGVFLSPYLYTTANDYSITKDVVYQISATPGQTVNTFIPTLLTGISADLRGQLAYNGGEPCTCGFEWGPTPSLGNFTPTTIQNTGDLFLQPISGLSPGTLYHTRTYATNSLGTVSGISQFTTIALPLVVTTAATGVGGGQADLNGTLNSDGDPYGGSGSDCGFEWGPTPAYGNTTPTTHQNTGDNFTQTVVGIIPGRTYHFRAVATNVAGTGYGADMTFLIPAPPKGLSGNIPHKMLGEGLI